MSTPAIDRISVEVARFCSKGCSFCYNASSARESAAWPAAALVSFATSCAANGVRTISFGGGEPLEYAPMFDVLLALRGVVRRSLTTNGLPLEGASLFERLVDARPEKVHVSIHAPENPREVERAIALALGLEARGVRSGINLLVRRSRLREARRAAEALAARGLGNQRIVYLPMRGEDTPSPAEVARVAGGRFQSMTCLPRCGRSPRFASIDADGAAAFCSYTRSRRRLEAPTYEALVRALDGLGLEPCDGDGLVRVERLARVGT